MCHMDVHGCENLVWSVDLEVAGMWRIILHSWHCVWYRNKFSIIVFNITFNVPSPLILTIPSYLVNKMFLISQISTKKCFCFLKYMWGYVCKPRWKLVGVYYEFVWLYPIPYYSSSDEVSLAWKILFLCISRLLLTLETCPFVIGVWNIGYYLFFKTGIAYLKTIYLVEFPNLMMITQALSSIIHVLGLYVTVSWNL